ncbi:hypothetical protein E8E13_000319 [Curvularia kusanoi]|uniref:Uncharacterized protein n=1 Tax=Curvularia kusanoi TaxID=90978 RepID=A0A9P4W473_CURKU|nr:hypothetical protein E8E13_000319 [Curvularia kusanoi]
MAPTLARNVRETRMDRETNKQTVKEHKKQQVNNARFQRVLERLHAYAADSLRYRHPVPYNQQLIDALRLEPAAYLPGASLAEVCTHFRQHHARISDPPELLDSEMTSPKYSWCLVIDDESLQSIEAAPEPIGTSPPPGVPSWDLVFQAENAFVILLSASYITMEKPVVISASIDMRQRTEWTGWLKFSPVILMDVFDQTFSGDIEIHFRGHDKLLEFP